MPAPVGIIGGTALSGPHGLDAGRESPVATPYGTPSGPLVRGRWAGREVVFLHRHGPEHRLAPHAINYRANIRALADAGVERIVAASAVGGIGPEMRPGRVVIPDQLIDYTWGRAHSFADEEGPVPHVDFTQPYDPDLRAVLVNAARGLDLDAVTRAVHGVTQGPRLETAAEIDRMDRDGCDIVGMTGMPEAALAREAGLAYACCAVVVNAAAGRGEGAIHAEIERTLAEGMATLGRLLDAVLPDL
ncbi:S-methyl-5'-thioinosine phosphorylase [Salinisphaera sp. PC39]|uniref:S-methyl-5'-thioinosine phosphorylase n=1 Tax=Salinisphaera sp. PC39 TaxID=1304156 RepID=UPI00333E48DA